LQGKNHIIIIKDNCREVGNISIPLMKTGRYGRTTNPFLPTADPCGNSRKGLVLSLDLKAMTVADDA
jgi:hypothetical protein